MSADVGGLGGSRSRSSPTTASEGERLRGQTVSPRRPDFDAKGCGLVSGRFATYYHYAASGRILRIGPPPYS